MVVSQYIYTACGKERTGAFSVFSKSSDITNEESAEIREVMMYKTPSGLPYEPAERQIEELFPKKFGYFFLSSGRVCLAQSCYVGRVYSELDGRFGNYILHAFVFEKTNDFAPYSFIEHPLFKRMLTRKEWHDDPIPDDLPRIEAPENGGMLTMNEIRSFLNEDRMNKLKYLIEAVINSSSENPVCFFDDFNNHKFWLKILSVCLPKIKQNEVSLCTHFTNTLAPGNISSRVQIRINQPENSLFNYAQDAQRGRYAFDFTRNIMPGSVKPGKYAENIVTMLSSGGFEAYADKVSKIMAAYSIKVNEAVNLLSISRADYSNFENADDIYNAILSADRTGYETQSIAENLWAGKPQFNFNARQKLDVYAFIYKNIPTTDTRSEIIKAVIDNAEQFGLRADSADAFRDDLKLKANFIFSNYLDYLKKEGLDDYITQNRNSFLKLFLTFDFLTDAPAVKNSFQTRKYNASEETAALRNIMNLTFKRQSVSDLDLLINSANSRIDGLGTELLSITVQDTLKQGFNITNVQFSFDILLRLRPKTNFAYAYLMNLIKTIPDKNELIKAYIKAQNNDPDFFTKFENENKNEALMADFRRKKDAFIFANQPLTPKVIREYFNKYYVTGADTGLFVKRLSEYLYAVKSEKKTSECFNILDLMKFPADADKALKPPAYGVVLDAVFSAPYEDIYSLCEKQEKFDKIKEIYDCMKNSGVGLKQETRELAIITFCGKIINKFGSFENKQVFLFFSKTSQSDTDYLAANFALINSEKSVNTFIHYYFKPAANILIEGAAAAGQFDYDGILKKVFGNIIERGDLEKIIDDIIYAINRSKAKAVIFVLYLFRKHLAASKNELEKRLGDIAVKIFEELSPGGRKKIFSELLALAEKTEIKQFERYFEEFNKEHKGGLFNLFKKKI